MLSLISTINEILVKQKEKFDSGTEHNIYQSKSNPDRLYKVGKRKVVEKWLHVFQQNPKYFPKVYKAGKLNTNIKMDFYVEIEKLNTKRVLDEWTQIEESLELLGYVHYDRDEYIDRLFQIGSVSEDLKYNLKRMDPKTYELFINWYNFIQKVKSIVSSTSKLSLDVHRYNFGYDSLGKMKCLDI